MSMEKRPTGQQGANPEAAEASTSIVGALLAVDAITDQVFANGAPVLASAGLFIFPFKVIDGEKTPLVKWGRGGKGQHADTDPEVIAGWCRRWPDAFVGIACKPSRLLVVDLDVKHPPVSGPDEWAKLTADSGDPDGQPACLYDRTTLIRTASGGLHLWFRDDKGIEGMDNFRPGIDIKAAQGDCGGFVAAPPTLGYSMLGLKPPMLVPGSLRHAIAKKRESTEEHATRARTSVSELFAPPAPYGLRVLVNRVLKAQVGDRNGCLHRTSKDALRGVAAGHYRAQVALDALWAAGEEIGLSPMEIRNALRLLEVGHA
jgi:Bifunctional DNA primase/polymerase, N-terminal